MAKKAKDPNNEKVPAASNRKARHLYTIVETFEAGLSLSGSEVKSLRNGKASLDGTFARADKGELWLHNFYIAPYSFARPTEFDESRRARKLLMHGREIRRLAQSVQTKGLTLVPLEIYFKRGWAKVELALAKGRNAPDQREAIKKKEATREAARAMRRR